MRSADAKLRRMAARILDRSGEPAPHELARLILDEETYQFLGPYVAFTRATHLDLRRRDGRHLVIEIKKDTLSPDIQADLRRLEGGEEPQTLEGRKVVALKRWERLNPDPLSYRVLFADDSPHDDGKRAVRDFVLGADCIYSA